MQSLNDHMISPYSGKALPSGSIYTTAASGRFDRAPSVISGSEETLRAARELAIRVENSIARLCGGADGENCKFGEGPDISVLGRLHRCSVETDSAISRANAALDRLDVELG